MGNGNEKEVMGMGMNGNQSTLRSHLQSSRHVGCDCTLSPPVDSCVSVCVCDAVCIVQCSDGTYYWPVTGRCQLCPADTYQPFSSRTSCVACPPGTGAPPGAFNVAQCQSCCHLVLVYTRNVHETFLAETETRLRPRCYKLPRRCRDVC